MTLSKKDNLLLDIIFFLFEAKSFLGFLENNGLKPSIKGKNLLMSKNKDTLVELWKDFFSSEAKLMIRANRGVLFCPRERILSDTTSPM